MLPPHGVRDGQRAAAGEGLGPAELGAKGGSRGRERCRRLRQHPWGRREEQRAAGPDGDMGVHIAGEGVGRGGSGGGG